MCAVKCAPRRLTEDPPRRRGLKFYLGLAIVLLSLGTVAAMKLDMPWMRQVTTSVTQSPAYLAMREASQPAARVASGDVKYMRRWVSHQRTPQLLMLCSAGVAMGLFYILWK